MKKSVKKVGICVTAFVIIAVIATLMSQDKVTDFHEKYAGTDLTSDIEGMERSGTYMQYLASHDQSKCPKQNIKVDLFDYSSAQDVEVYSDYEGSRFYCDLGDQCTGKRIL